MFEALRSGGRSNGARGVAALFLWLALSPGRSAAGPWAPEPGHGYGKVAGRILPGFSFFPGPEAAERGLEGPQPYGPYLEAGVQTYVEVGLAPRLALFAAIDPVRLFVFDDAVDPARHWLNVGEPLLGIRGAFSTWPVAAAVEVAVRIPTVGDAPVAVVHRVGDRAPVGALQVGTASFDTLVALHLGRGWPRFYLSASGGVELRTAGYHPVVFWSAELGRKMGRQERAWLRLRLQGHHPVPVGSAPFHGSPSGLGNGTRYVGFTLEWAREIRDGWSFELSLAGGVAPVARQTGGPVFTVGLGRVF